MGAGQDAKSDLPNVVVSVDLHRLSTLLLACSCSQLIVNLKSFHSLFPNPRLSFVDPRVPLSESAEHGDGVPLNPSLCSLPGLLYRVCIRNFVVRTRAAAYDYRASEAPKSALCFCFRCAGLATWDGTGLNDWTYCRGPAKQGVTKEERVSVRISHP
ncbi:hypothetical protein BDP81DRAFT_48517 [Colletotrichum phormii]|uniref:Uncharacterized protein n=1 Tax=Colletotrichum phormii TaxID=359342 RepID=A0AAI9ZNM5_9PEZI|nr:uncharacterized protein BDP81DRAFT_48517 [Colletotrichum phormii]KAK1635315.1 hypothetical protein BDP81DRAFT_48517 [Colletotrichum phormii]